MRILSADMSYVVGYVYLTTVIAGITDFISHGRSELRCSFHAADDRKLAGPLTHFCKQCHFWRPHGVT